MAVPWCVTWRCNHYVMWHQNNLLCEPCAEFMSVPSPGQPSCWGRTKGGIHVATYSAATAQLQKARWGKPVYMPEATVCFISTSNKPLPPPPIYIVCARFNPLLSLTLHINLCQINLTLSSPQHLVCASKCYIHVHVVHVYNLMITAIYGFIYPSYPSESILIKLRLDLKEQDTVFQYNTHMILNILYTSIYSNAQHILPINTHTYRDVAERAFGR